MNHLAAQVSPVLAGSHAAALIWWVTILMGGLASTVGLAVSSDAAGRVSFRKTGMTIAMLLGLTMFALSRVVSAPDLQMESLLILFVGGFTVYPLGLFSDAQDKIKWQTASVCVAIVAGLSVLLWVSAETLFGGATHLATGATPHPYAAAAACAVGIVMGLVMVAALEQANGIRSQIEKHLGQVSIIMAASLTTAIMMILNT